MKKILSLLLITTTAFGLAGCSSKRDTSVDMQLAGITTKNAEARLTSNTSATFGNMSKSTHVSLNSHGAEQMTFKFYYNGAVPIVVTEGVTDENGETHMVDTGETVSLNTTLLNDTSSETKLKTAYAVDTTKMYVNYVSYTTTITEISTGNVTSTTDFLGAPFRYGMMSGIKLPEIVASYDESLGVFVFEVTHEKLLAKVSDEYITSVEINSIDIALTERDFDDSDEFNYNMDETATNIWDSDKVTDTFIGKIDSENFNEFDKYIGAICLRNNDGVFEFIAPPTSLQESYNQYSFLKYDGENTISIDDTHLTNNHDRYMATYDSVKSRIKNIELNKHWVNNGTETGEFLTSDVDVDKINLIEDLFKMKFEITDNSGTTTVSYFYDIEDLKLYVYELNGGSWRLIGNSFEYEFDCEYEELSILAYGCNIVNTSYTLEVNGIKGGVDVHFFTEDSPVELNLSSRNDQYSGSFSKILVVMNHSSNAYSELKIIFDGYGESYTEITSPNIIDGIYIPTINVINQDFIDLLIKLPKPTN